MIRTTQCPLCGNDSRIHVDTLTGKETHPINLEKMHLQHAEGIPLRDYFAAAALQGLKSNPNVDSQAEFISKLAYRYADTMLAARGNKGEQPNAN